jgi:hypothetical protein
MTAHSSRCLPKSPVSRPCRCHVAVVGGGNGIDANNEDDHNEVANDDGLPARNVLEEGAVNIVHLKETSLCGRAKGIVWPVHEITASCHSSSATSMPTSHWWRFSPRRYRWICPRAAIYCNGGIVAVGNGDEFVRERLGRIQIEPGMEILLDQSSQMIPTTLGIGGGGGLGGGGGGAGGHYNKQQGGERESLLRVCRIASSWGGLSVRRSPSSRG